MVEGQLFCLGSMLPQPSASIRRPSAHLCQFPAQYANSAEFFKRAPPVARWTPNPNPNPNRNPNPNPNRNPNRNLNRNPNLNRNLNLNRNRRNRRRRRRQSWWI